MVDLLRKAERRGWLEREACTNGDSKLRERWRVTTSGAEVAEIRVNPPVPPVPPVDERCGTGGDDTAALQGSASRSPGGMGVERRKKRPAEKREQQLPDADNFRQSQTTGGEA